MSTLTTLTRRTFLRGMLGGASISLGLPALEAFLNTSGTAWAVGAPLPQRFGTWFWGCGLNPARWNPATTGASFDLDGSRFQVDGGDSRAIDVNDTVALPSVSFG